MTKYSYEQRIRLQFNNNALRAAHQRFKKADFQLNASEGYAAIGEILLWLLTTEEWHLVHRKTLYCEEKAKTDAGKTIKGLKYSYNLMKHNMKFSNLHEIKKEGGFSFPFSGPFIMGIESIVWVKAGESLKGKYNSQKKKL